MKPKGYQGVNRYDALWSEEWQILQQVGPMTRTRYRLILKELASILPGASNVLDVGCGNGTLIELIQEKYPTIACEGVEGSLEAANAASETMRGQIRVGDIYKMLPEINRNFDAVVCSEVLEHLDQPGLALELMRDRVLPRGYGVFTVPAGRRWWSKLDIHAGHVQRFEREEFCELLDRAGWQPHRVYGWGISIALLYDRLTVMLGPERVLRTGKSSGGAFLGQLLVRMFSLEDYWPSDYGVQLVAVCRRTT